MSSIKGAQKEMAAASMDSLSKPKETGTMPIYPSPPNSPPQTELNIPKARTESEDELRSSKIVSSVLLTPPTSPQSSSNLTRSEQRPAESQRQMNASTLKNSLGLDEWLCGCVGKKGPCRIPIRKANKNPIDSHIESMIPLTRSSPELEAELDKLFMLVHCRHHGQQKDARLEEWKIAFPVGDADTKPIVSIEKQIIKALGQLSAECIWETLEGEPCNKSIGGQRVQNCAKTIDEIAKSEIYLKDAHLDYLLKVLETNMYCPDHIDKPHFKKVALWKSKVIEIRETANSELMQPIESDLLNGLTSQTHVPNTPDWRSFDQKK